MVVLDLCQPGVNSQRRFRGVFHDPAMIGDQLHQLVDLLRHASLLARDFHSDLLPQAQADRELKQRLARRKENQFRAKFQSALTQLMICRRDATVLVQNTLFHTAAFDDGKNIQCQAFVGEQIKKPRQLGYARTLVVTFVTMIVIMIFRRRSQLRPQIDKLRRWPVELKLEAAELQMSGLLCKHYFEKSEVLRFSLESIN